MIAGQKKSTEKKTIRPPWVVPLGLFQKTKRETRKTEKETPGHATMVSPNGPPSCIVYANPRFGMTRDERFLQSLLSPQLMSSPSSSSPTDHPKNKRLTEQQLLGTQLVSTKTVSFLSPPATRSGSRRPLSTGKKHTLCSAVRSGSTQAVYRLLHESGVDINNEERTESGEACTPLCEAIRTRDLSTTRLLLDFQADPTLGLSDSPTTTPISLAAASGDGDPDPDPNPDPDPDH